MLGQENKIRHETDRITRSPVLTGIFDILLIEAAHKLLEHRAHGVIVQAGQIPNGMRAEIDVMDRLD
jgi:hypothetical protein